MNPGRFRFCAVGLFVTSALLAGTGTASAAGLALPAPWRRASSDRGRSSWVPPRPAGSTSMAASRTSRCTRRRCTPTCTSMCSYPRGTTPPPAPGTPVLYLLHGALGSYRDWPAHGVEGFVGDTPIDRRHARRRPRWFLLRLVRLPSSSSWASHRRGSRFTPANWCRGSTRTTRRSRPPGGRFIAGLSSGGGGAMKYASAHPGLFGAAGEFSGAVDTDLPGYSGTASLIWDLSYLPGGGPPAHCTWGDPSAQEVVWRDNDPTYLGREPSPAPASSSPAGPGSRARSTRRLPSPTPSSPRSGA